jgi:hypothetical protein
LFFVSTGPDLRGGRGAAFDKLGAGDGESCFIIVFEVIILSCIRAAVSVIFVCSFNKIIYC